MPLCIGLTLYFTRYVLVNQGHIKTRQQQKQQKRAAKFSILTLAPYCITDPEDFLAGYGKVK